MTRRTKIFLLYNDEDISKYSHPDIIPLKLNQTEYFESEAFRMITPDMVPEVEQIGCIVPSYFKRTRCKNLDQLFQVNISHGFHKIKKTTAVCDVQFADYHGENASKIWTWLLEQLDLQWTRNKYNLFHSNLWITTRDTFIEYLAFAKKVITLIDNAPSDIQNLLSTNPKYPGKLIGTGILEKRFGKPYYPWQPFILERVVCLFDYVQECKNSPA